jgi:hypothetical protein
MVAQCPIYVNTGLWSVWSGAGLLLTQLYTCIERVILFNNGGRSPRAALFAPGNDAGGAWLACDESVHAVG